jgi:GntR family histidine utilization transcriptional repressor
MTINRALRELTDEGLLVRLQGVGTFVAEPKGQSALFEVRSIAEKLPLVIISTAARCCCWAQADLIQARR